MKNKYFIIIRIMKSLTLYLLKDISNIILDYLYKPDIEKLNREYHNNYMIDGYYRVKHKSGFSYNFRSLNINTCSVYISNIKRYIAYINHSSNLISNKTYLSRNYIYSSGCELLCGYKYREL